MPRDVASGRRSTTRGGVPDDDNNVLSLRERLRCANAKIDELMKAYGAALAASGSKDADVQRSYAQKC